MPQLVGRIGQLHVATAELSSLAQARDWPAYSRRLRAELALVPLAALKFFVGSTAFVYVNGDVSGTHHDVVSDDIGQLCHFGVQAALANELLH